MQLSSIDLNLLVVLDALLETHSVKLAARRVALSPSAMSHALGRLRRLLDDPILVRAGTRLVPSTRAALLRGDLRAVLEGVERLLGPGELEIARLRRAFTIATIDYGEVLILPALSHRVAELAPGVVLNVRTIGLDPMSLLRSMECDLFIGVFPPTRDDIVREVLFDDEFVCVLRRGHPALRRQWTAERFAALEHVLVAPRGATRGVVDDVLASLGLERRIARTCSTFLAAPRLVAGSDYVLTLSARVAKAFAVPLGLVVRPPPIAMPRISVEQAWHRRSDGDPAHRWLRSIVSGVVTDTSEERRPRAFEEGTAVPPGTVRRRRQPARLRARR